jgi:hypothetical protein
MRLQPLGGVPDIMRKLIAALENAGVEFIDENGGRAVVRFKKARRTATKPQKGD